MLNGQADGKNVLVPLGTPLSVKAFAKHLESLSAATRFTSALSNQSLATQKQHLELLL